MNLTDPGAGNAERGNMKQGKQTERLGASANKSLGAGEPSIEGRGLFSMQIDHAAAQAAMQPWVEMDCSQLSRGKRLGQVDSLNLGSLQVVRERQEASIQKVGVTPPDFCSISYCTQDPTFRFSEHREDADNTIFILPELTEFDLYIPAGASTGYVSVSQERFMHGARVLNPKAWECSPREVMQFTTNDKSKFKALVDLWIQSAASASACDEVLDPSVMQTILFDAVLAIVSEATQEEAPALTIHARRRALGIAKQARDFVEGRSEVEDLPSIVDLCEAIGVSERTLQYAFKEYIGMSPVMYLRMRRLNRARKALLEAHSDQTTVTKIAMQHGFLHLGRFAGDYKQMFDEPPSVTLAC